MADKAASGMIRQRAGQEEQDQQDDRHHHQERQLAATAGAVDDLRLRGAAVDDEGAGQAGANIGQGQTDQVGVLAETLAVARGIGAGGRRALRQDDHEHRKGRRNQGRDDGASSSRPWADPGVADHSERLRPHALACRSPNAQLATRAPIAAIKAPGIFFETFLRPTMTTSTAERDHQLVAVDLSELLKVVPELPQRAVAAPLQAQHAGDLPQRDLNADPGQEPDQHGAREEVGQESQAHDARQNQENRGHQRQHAGQRQVLHPSRSDAIPTRPAARMAAVAESAPTTRCREEPNNGEQRRGDEHGVETGDHRRAGDLGVAHHLWDGDCGKRDTGKDFSRDPSGRDRQHPLQDGEADGRGVIVC